MNYFISYRHTGADPERLAALLPEVCNALKHAGHNVYCTYFNEHNFKRQAKTPAQVMQHAFEKIDEMGNLFVVLDSEEKSEGMLMEVGYCIAKNMPVTVAVRKSVASSYLPTMANRVLYYEDTKDLVEEVAAPAPGDIVVEA